MEPVTSLGGRSISTRHFLGPVWFSESLSTPEDDNCIRPQADLSIPALRDGDVSQVWTCGGRGQEHRVRGSVRVRSTGANS